MPLKPGSPLMPRFLVLFAAGGALVLCWSFLESYFIKRLSLAFQMRIAIPLTSLILLILVVGLGLFVWRRLGAAARAGVSGETAGAEARAFRNLLRLPWELFVWTVLYAVVAIPAYHVIHYALIGHSLLHVGASYWQNFIRSFMYELCVGTSAAILYYSVSRRLIRPALARLAHVQSERLEGRSFLTLLTTTFGALLMINLLSVLWYVWVAEAKHEPFRWAVLLALVGLEWLFAGAILVMLAAGFRRELQLLASGLRALLLGDRGAARPKMPVLASDEIGELAVAFNRLQERLHRDYEEMAGELRLARGLQLGLLPPARQTLGGFDLAAMAETSAEVGSGFYDVAPLRGGGFAAVVGDASGEGLPAALQMSAAMLLLRAELDGHGTPEAMLERFGAVLQEVYPAGAELSAGVVVADAAGSEVAIALQGGMRGWLRRGADAEDAGRPLAAGERLRLRAGDRVCLYSAAAAEAALRTGGLPGLRPPDEVRSNEVRSNEVRSNEVRSDGLPPDDGGRALAALEPGEPLARQLAAGLMRMRAASGPRAQGDAVALLLAAKEAVDP
ncbi:PP2C family protein-serine/threonine phosphatase [Cohnella sp. 56]|uniref:PP2C family protein-serine/threonine phosphatase n=1 Tax=Cohnella sp. 56 TaxID=3113722 RepID=UPI0030EA15D9